LSRAEALKPTTSATGQDGFDRPRMSRTIAISQALLAGIGGGRDAEATGRPIGSFRVWTLSPGDR
jgi:hypothetical protein